MGTTINGIFVQLDMQMIQLFLLDNLEGSLSTISAICKELELEINVRPSS